MNEPEIVKYKLSKDKVGLVAYYANGGFYHIHSDELTSLENWIHKALGKQPKRKLSEKKIKEIVLHYLNQEPMESSVIVDSIALALAKEMERR